MYEPVVWIHEIITFMKDVTTLNFNINTRNRVTPSSLTSKPHMDGNTLQRTSTWHSNPQVCKGTWLNSS